SLSLTETPPVRPGPLYIPPPPRSRRADFSAQATPLLPPFDPLPPPLLAAKGIAGRTLRSALREPQNRRTIKG
ncbi:hypothetical protein E2320_005011, partial [Naja naja]